MSSKLDDASFTKASEFSKTVPHSETIKNDVIYCRICLGSSDFEELISPCYCAGTIGIVHQRCLEKWLNLSRSKTCEICGFTFEVLKHYPHFCKWLWMGGKGDGIHRRRYLWTDLICLLIMIPLLTLCAWLAISSNQDEKSANSRRFPWQSFFLGLLCSLLLLVFNIWLMFSFRYHHQSWKLWRKEQSYIVLSESVKRKKVMDIKRDPQNPNLIIQNNKQEQNQQLKRLDMLESNETSMKPNKTIDDSELAINRIRQQCLNAESYSGPIWNMKSEICDEITNTGGIDSTMIHNKLKTLSTEEVTVKEDSHTEHVVQTEPMSFRSSLSVFTVPTESCVNDTLNEATK
ncbi:unnamed protein product [Schistosoma margrebowiei]|uniref:RING-CH-type domain-containing protein n=1 Tax=Schistosoma margrebowiei TaxID=48269 RepID=A0AA84ZJI3_9TREM|nr:unnamed protein product [Schistosoma margrebowiei]